MPHKPWNPYLEDFQKVIPEWQTHALERTGQSFYSMLDAGSFIEYSRAKLLGKYSWAIPGPEAIAALAAHGKIIEVGAGSGYWARVLTEAGADVIATDDMSWNPENVGGFQIDNARWHPVERMDASAAAAAYPDRLLLFVWPPRETGMALKAVKAHYRAGGTHVAYVGERGNACTGSIMLEHRLASLYHRPIAISIPQWDHVRDYLRIFTRKEP
jgi:hypothetical protein